MASVRTKTIPSIIARLPKAPTPPEGVKKTPGFAMRAHKNGLGRRVMRESWRRYDEPTYWRITKYRPPMNAKGTKPRVWGILTWRGVAEDKARLIRGIKKKEWRLLPRDEGPFVYRYEKK